MLPLFIILLWSALAFTSLPLRFTVRLNVLGCLYAHLQPSTRCLSSKFKVPLWEFSLALIFRFRLSTKFIPAGGNPWHPWFHSGETVVLVNIWCQLKSCGAEFWWANTPDCCGVRRTGGPQCPGFRCSNLSVIVSNSLKILLILMCREVHGVQRSRAKSLSHKIQIVPYICLSLRKTAKKNIRGKAGRTY